MFKLLKQRKAIILHPVTWIVVAFILGAALMYLIGSGIIPVQGLSFCPTK